MMATVLCWNFMYCSFDKKNEDFGEFQVDSETLVTGTIKAEEAKTWFKNPAEHNYGLGRFYTAAGLFMDYEPLSSIAGAGSAGYAKTEPTIRIVQKKFTEQNIKDAVAVRFGNGDVFNIAKVTEIVDNESYFIVELDADRAFNPLKHGGIDQLRFIRSDGSESEPGLITAYQSQVGLQGKIYRFIARQLPFAFEEKVAALHLLNSIATAVVLTLLVILLSKKYNKILAGTFYLVFLLSPWIVNFGRNLYWVEFTWFIPMLVGLFCAMHFYDKKCRIASYIAMYASITLKCLCGYEYISSVMLGGIAFLLVELLLAITEKDKAKTRRLFVTIFLLGVAALAGFATALCVHAPLRGEGDLMLGLSNILKEDALRRTYGGDLNDFDFDTSLSQNASAWKVLCMYFDFKTEIVTGTAGNLFPLLCCIPLGIFGYDYQKKQLNKEHAFLYLVFFLVATSWFVLAKSHSYVHRHMNFVLWYMGYVQICFYVIVDKIIKAFRGRKVPAGAASEEGGVTAVRR